MGGLQCTEVCFGAGPQVFLSQAGAGHAKTFALA